MEVALLVFLTLLAAGLLKFINAYRSRDKYPPLPTVPRETTVSVLLDPSTLTLTGCSSLGADTTGHHAYVSCDSGGHGVSGSGHCGDGGGGSHH